MAIFIPPKKVVATRSNAERKVIDWLSRLPDTFTVLHSIGILNHPFKNWAEADVVIVGPGGILVIEVKGGKIQRKDGRWGFTRADGETTWKKEGPYDQAGGASAALRARMLELQSIEETTRFGYGVILTDCAAPTSDSAFLSEVTLDAMSSWASPAFTLQRWSDYWAKRSNRSDGLSEAHVAKVVQSLRRDFELLPMLSLEVAAAEDQLTRATNEQSRIVAAQESSNRMVIKGGAGTGKTLLALNESLRLAEAGESVLVLCASRYLSRALSDAASRTGQVSQPEFAAIEDTKVLTGRYDAVIIDEAQDLSFFEIAELLDRLTSSGMSRGKWRVFLDPDQALFQRQDLELHEALAAFSDATLSLKMNCRNTGPISTKTSMLARIPIGSEGGVSGPSVDQHWWRNREDHDVSLVTALKSLVDALGPENITVLSHDRIDESRLADWGRRTGIDFSLLGEQRQGCVRVATTADFKGFDDEAIIVADVDDLDSTLARSQLYVACTRARAHLTVLLSEAAKEDFELARSWFAEQAALKMLANEGVGLEPVTRIG